MMSSVSLNRWASGAPAGKSAAGKSDLKSDLERNNRRKSLI